MEEELLFLIISATLSIFLFNSKIFLPLPNLHLSFHVTILTLKPIPQTGQILNTLDPFPMSGFGVQLLLVHFGRNIK